MKFEKTTITKINDKERMAFNTTLFAFDDIYDFMMMNDFSIAEIGDSKVSLEEITHIMAILEEISNDEVKFFE